MKLTIEIEMGNAAFQDDPTLELSRIMETVAGKISRQLQREDGCICVALEIDDKLLDRNGNTVGFVKLEKQ